MAHILATLAEQAVRQEFVLPSRMLKIKHVDIFLLNKEWEELQQGSIHIYIFFFFCKNCVFLWNMFQYINSC